MIPDSRMRTLAARRARARLPGRPPRRRGRPAGDPSALAWFVRAQAVNTKRSAAALRPFRLDEFGKGPASPSPAHIQAANQLLVRLRRPLLAAADKLDPRTESGRAGVDSIPRFLSRKQRTLRQIKAIEKVWDFYQELFGQRLTPFAPWLLAADRIGLDCYQAVYTGLGTARSIPAPPPLAYMETGSTPATYRRGVTLTRLGKRANPFPVVQLPYHRLINPWTLGAVHHEVSHNLQSDLGLWQEVPRRILGRLERAGVPRPVAVTWARWHKEMWADLGALLLGGPAIVASLLGVLARSRRTTQGFNPAGVHPTPYLRTFISLELLRRMGFSQEAAGFQRLWRRLYPAPERSTIPRAMLDSFDRANQVVVDTICFQPYPQLGGRSLAQVTRFTENHQRMTEEAARRIAAGVDPGIVPARFLVGAARLALDQRLAPPGRITAHFYQALERR